jgi:hypothetical protein
LLGLSSKTILTPYKTIYEMQQRFRRAHL